MNKFFCSQEMCKFCIGIIEETRFIYVVSEQKISSKTLTNNSNEVLMLIGK